MYCVAIYESGNYALKVLKILETNGYIFEVIATPCQIAKGGCSYCIKFPEEYQSIVLQQSSINGAPVREIYLIKPLFSKNQYVKIY